MSESKCIGFGEYESVCENTRGELSRYWCDRCETLRRAHISMRLEQFEKRFIDKTQAADGGEEPE